MTDARDPPRDGDPSDDEGGEDDEDDEDGADGADGEDDEDDEDGPSTEAVYEAMAPLEPYTTGELASVLGVPGRLARRLLDRLADEGTIRRKEPEPERVIWIREPPKQECPNCGGEFEVKHFHPVFQAVQFCPRCGTRLRKRGRD